MCCKEPAVTFGWRLGVDGVGGTIIEISHIECTACHAQFRFGGDEHCKPDVWFHPEIDDRMQLIFAAKIERV